MGENKSLGRRILTSADRKTGDPDRTEKPVRPPLKERQEPQGVRSGSERPVRGADGDGKGGRIAGYERQQEDAESMQRAAGIADRLRDKLRRIRLSPFQIIILGFLAVILLGTLLLLLPFARKGGELSFLDALFTATSAVCVTGLVVRDTATFWTGFGQAVILTLIQIGGLGIATAGLSLALLRREKIGLSQRILLTTANSQNGLGRIPEMTTFVLKAVAAVELSGAVLLSFAFIPEFGFGKGIWYSFFHSISAFCNAGFDLMGFREKYSSLTAYSSNAYVQVVVMALIILGGISFLTYRDVKTYGLRVRRYRLQTKMILSITLVLLLFPAILFFFTEFDGLPGKERVLASLFQSVTTRTAGFNTMPLDQMTEPGQMLMIVLMLIGGAPGSTAGGMKVTTVFVLMALFAQIFTKSGKVHCFRRSLGGEAVRDAAVIFAMYVFLLVTGCICLCHFESVTLTESMFETASALGTVGLTLGITPSLGTAAKILLTCYMFIGRVGGLTLLYALLFRKTGGASGRFPEEDVAVG